MLEVSSKIYPLLGPLHEYLISRVPEGSNVLRGSILQRIEMEYFTAYVHVCALMWEVAFFELRFLTNSKKVQLNPCELYDLYEKMCVMAETMRGDAAFDLFEDAYRPWARVHPGNADLQRWYERKSETHNAKMETLRNFQHLQDYDGYSQVLREVVKLFGDAILVSFQRNIGEWLERTDGDKSNSKLTATEKDKKK